MQSQSQKKFGYDYINLHKVTKFTGRNIKMDSRAVNTVKHMNSHFKAKQCGDKMHRT